PIKALIFVTPLCAARLKRRPAVEALLRERGAHDDIFTHALLGDLSRLEADLAVDPGLAQAGDPAVDALTITPLHHAVAGGHVEALRVLISLVDARGEPVLNADRALRDAVAQQDVGMVRLLLDHGADARRLGGGRWVLDPNLAPLLAQAGARVDR